MTQGSETTDSTANVLHLGEINEATETTQIKGEGARLVVTNTHGGALEGYANLGHGLYGVSYRQGYGVYGYSYEPESRGGVCGETLNPAVAAVQGENKGGL
jgi:hypothetical protein